MGEYPNSGIMFRNDKKGDNPKAADYRGEGEVNGVPVWINGWVKDGKRGKFLSLSIKPKDAPREQAPPTQEHHQESNEPVPF